MKKFLKNDRGGVLVMNMVALGIALLVCSATIDLGFGYIKKSRVESIAMRASESAETFLPDFEKAREVGAKIIRAQLREMGDLENSEFEITESDERIVVMINSKVSPLFGYFFGKDAIIVKGKNYI